MKTIGGDGLSRRRFMGGSLVVAAGAGGLGKLAFAQIDGPVGEVRALTFDVFGTVVDWRSSIAREGQLLAAGRDFDVDWYEFADRWRGGYGPSMNRVRTGELPWTKIDVLHRMILDDLIEEYGLQELTEEERVHFNYAWHRLSPWPDSVAGLNRLKTRYVITTLSNGNVALLTNMAKNAGLPWDAILSAELAGRYKPDPEVYLKAADLLGLAPEQVMMVAAHPGDLRASSALGMRTGYVPRPLERGPNPSFTPDTSGDFDVTATDFLDLARQLGA